MKLTSRVRPLGPVDHTALKDAVSAVDGSVWIEDPHRQTEYDVHEQTQSIIMLFCDGWPQVEVTKRRGWDYFAAPARPIIERIVRTYYRPTGQVIRAMVAKLVAGGEIAPHEDAHPSFAISHRVHIPLMTNDLVDFVIDGQTFHLREGVAYEVSNLHTHSVRNRSAEDRVHFIFDYLER